MSADLDPVLWNTPVLQESCITVSTALTCSLSTIYVCLADMNNAEVTAYFTIHSPWSSWRLTKKTTVVPRLRGKQVSWTWIESMSSVQSRDLVTDSWRQVTRKVPRFHRRCIGPNLLATKSTVQLRTTCQNYWKVDRPKLRTRHQIQKIVSITLDWGLKTTLDDCFSTLLFTLNT